MADILIIGVLSVWLLVTVICQFQPGFKKIIRWPDFLLFVLGTRLFVRMPAHLHIWYRDAQTMGDPGPWTPVAWEGGKSWACLFWAPLPWRELHLFGIVNRVLRMQGRRREKHVSNVWYRLLLGYVRGLPRPDQSTARQFRIVRGGGHVFQGEPAIIFTSEFHPW